MSHHDDDDSSKPAGGSTRATRELVRAYLGHRETQAHIRDVIAGALGRRANASLVDDIANAAQVDALTSKTLAETADAIPEWVDGIARNKVKELFAGERKDAKVFPRGADPETADAMAPTDEDASDWRVSTWLRDQVADNATEREVYEVLVAKSRAKRKTYAELAAERGVSLASLSNGIYRLRVKYEPLWKQHKRERNRAIALWIGGGVVLIALAVLAWWLLRPAPPPVPVVKPPAPAMTTVHVLPEFWPSHPAPSPSGSTGRE